MGDEGQEGRKRIEFDEESDEDDDSQAKANEKPKVAASSDDKNAKYLANMVKSLQGQLKKAVTSLKTAETDLQKYKTAEQERAAQEVEGPKQAPDSIRKITGKRKVATPGPPTYETPRGKKNKTSIGNTKGSGTEEDDSEDEEDEEKADSEWETWIRGLIRQIVASALGSNKSFSDAMT